MEAPNKDFRFWIRIAFLNLMIVAFLGVIMRYKIAYSLPFINQKNLLQSHSHFAFAGWVTQLLMAMMVNYLHTKGHSNAFQKYKPVLYANLLTAYGMLLTFPFIGYKMLSIIFSTLSIFASYWFVIKFWIDLNKLPQKNSSVYWFKAALLFNVISSLGAYSLAYMITMRSIHPDNYLASIYFFLHFQYNGWFFFACMGLLAHRLHLWGANNRNLNIVFLLFAFACIPAYLLSALWLSVPNWFYILVVVAVGLQLTGWLLLVKTTKKLLPVIKNQIPLLTQRLFLLSAIALTIKLLLQTGSVIPSLSILAFGFRPIVIGYLHLVLLGVITLFLLSYVFAFRFVTLTKSSQLALIVFTIGILLNELFLMIQGIADLYYVLVPKINLLLLGAAIVLLLGMMLLNIAQKMAYGKLE
ncbi:MAG: hypothetical protein R2796_03425 [Chitinophagaceae bacterium]|nr:hypothetical protein [Chitinophagaceae bacterium]